MTIRTIFLVLLSIMLTACQFQLLEPMIEALPADLAATKIQQPVCPWIVSLEDSLIVSAKWEVGEQKRYDFFKYRLERREDGSQYEGESVTGITVSVIDKNDDGYIVEWHHGPTKLVSPDGNAIPSANEALELPEGLIIAYSTNLDGSYTGLYKVADVIRSAEGIFEAIVTMVIEESGDPDAGEDFRLAVQHILSNPALFESLFTRYIQGLHSPLGIQFDGETLYTFQDLLPSPIGGQPFLTDTEIQLEKYSAEQQCARIAIRNLYDPEAARQSMLDALTQQALQLEATPPTESDLPGELNIQDKMHFDVELQTGWPIELQIERIIQLGPLFRLDRQRMVQVP